MARRVLKPLAVTRLTKSRARHVRELEECERLLFTISESLKQVPRLEARVEEIKQTLVHIDEAIKVLMEEVVYVPFRNRVGRVTPLKGGQLIRTALRILRQTGEWMTVRELVFAALRAHGEPADNHIVDSMASSLRGSLNLQVGHGILQRAGRPQRWAIARDATLRVAGSQSSTAGGAASSPPPSSESNSPSTVQTSARSPRRR
jgi:hypothetical protein